MFGSAFGGGLGMGFPFGGVQSTFNDPFFSDPFGHMERMMDPHFGRRQEQSFPGGHGVARSRNEPVTIEEVHGDAADYVTMGDEGIVEEPDDDASPRPAKRQETAGRTHASNQNTDSAQRRTGTRQIPVQGPTAPRIDPFAPMQLSAMHGQPGLHHAYSFSSTTFSSGGRNGVTYQSTQTARMGPGGVREVQSSVRDGRTGEQSMTITRGLADKERTVTRSRDATGREVKDEVLRGIHQEEAERFEAEWMDHAEQNLAPYGGSGSLSRRAGGTQPSAAPLQLQAPAAPHTSSQRMPATSAAHTQRATQAAPSAYSQPAAPMRTQPQPAAHLSVASQRVSTMQPPMQRGAPATSVRMRGPEQHSGGGVSYTGAAGAYPGGYPGASGGYAGAPGGYAGASGGYAGNGAASAGPYVSGGNAGGTGAGYGAAARSGYTQQGGAGTGNSYFNTGRFA